MYTGITIAFNPNRRGKLGFEKEEQRNMDRASPPLTPISRSQELRS